MKKRVITYCQCRLEKHQGNSLLKQVAYIPQKFAKLNSSIKLKSEDGNWDFGWVVRSVGSQCQESDLPDSHRGIKEHKKLSGDSLPKLGNTNSVRSKR